MALVRGVLGECQVEGKCMCCRETPQGTRQYCQRCVRFLCNQCMGHKSVPIAPVGICTRCRTKEATKHQVISKRALARELVRLEARWEEKVLRKATRASQKRGLVDLKKFGDRAGESLFPMEDTGQAARHIIWSVQLREPTLDASTIKNYCQGISAAHEFLRAALKLPNLLNPMRTARVRRLLRVAMNEYKKPSKAKHYWTTQQFKKMLRQGFDLGTRSGRHRRLALWFHTLGVVRKSAGARLRVKYRIRRDSHGQQQVVFSNDSPVQVCRDDHISYIKVVVSKDKNVQAWKHRTTYIPARVKALDINPVAALEKYLIDERPPSGGFLLAAPLGKNGWRTTPYSNQSNAFKQAYEKSQGLPSGTPAASMYGSQSCRKSMAQWLWDDDWDKRVIADHGGWALQRDAVDIYFKTGRVKMLWAITHLGHVQRARRKKLQQNIAPVRNNVGRRDGDR